MGSDVLALLQRKYRYLVVALYAGTTSIATVYINNSG